MDELGDYHLALACQLAYGDDRRVFCDAIPGVHEAYPIEFKNDLAWLLVRADQCLLIFRGSNNNAADWVGKRGNTNVAHVRHELGFVHEGYWRSIIEGQALLTHEWETYGDSRTLLVAGHSRGGGLAQVFAWQFRSMVERVATFGSPRAFSRSWARAFNKYFNARSTRYVHRSDPVTLLPFRLGYLLGGYRHVGQLRWWTGHKWREKTRWLGWLALSIKAAANAAREKVTGDDDGRTDHSIENYVEILMCKDQPIY